MTVRSSYSTAVRADLLDIWLYIAQADSDAADRQLDRLEAAVQRLLDFPDIGHAKEEVGPAVRVLVQDRYLIIYRHLTEERTVIIERIAHGRRNLAALFD